MRIVDELAGGVELDYPVLMQDHDAVAVQQSVGSVGDGDHGTGLGEESLHLGLRLGIERSGALVDQEDLFPV